ncbi:hypothetical protein HHK36_011185 [Tetracentron sinense]|uniref:DUF547 domain-containing protein n=1 Tax=Tetracentron sinense TaxID=13715 RepID=A0A834ZBH7_TETSI|nr:hypothetical protein HHK36_011185 [Tetracentron sinense]
MMPHPQLRRLAENRKKTEPESSFSSTTALNSNQTTTDHSFLDSKPRSLSHQNQTFPCCFNVSSKRWPGLKLSCLSISLMATQGDLEVHVPSARKKKNFSGQQRREELEQEVSMLHKMLNQEQKVHEILERVYHRTDGSSLHIPNFLPPKMKELLAELAMVEDEIARLEGEISHLQIGLRREQEINEESKSKQWQHGISNPPDHSSTPSDPASTNKGVHERLAFETKALYFINKAIKGDYRLSQFSNNEKMGNSRGTTDQKENLSHEEVGFQEKVPRKSGLQKPLSPIRPRPRHPTPKPVQRDPEVSLDLPPKSLSNSIQPEDISPKWQPNKLSESIMKCLIFIFVRLIRTSRSMELERSGTILRSTHSSLSSRSFRGETALSSKATLQKESKQQDPYGIFNIEESIPRDIGPYKNFVIFTSSSLGSKSISSSSSISLLQKLRALMNHLQNLDMRFLTYQEKLAFWINMYNACIMHGFLQYGVPSSQEKLLRLMNKATLNIGGNKINALAIEHFILRQQSSSVLKDFCWSGEVGDKEALVRSIYGLESAEPNVAFALCCGTRSSPAVRIYTADGVSAELEKSKLEYLQASIVVTNTRKLAIPELLLRNMLEFAGDVDSLVEWVCDQLPASGSLKKSMVDCFRGHNSGKVSSIVEKMPYEFEFQYLLAI